MNQSPSILWITLDSVRADHTSLHNYHRDTTPNLAKIGSCPGGQIFEHGIAHSTRTPISVPSMMTGLYPSRHRMIGKESTKQIPKLMDTVPEILSKRGYHTIGISENGFAGGAKGIDERFDEFVKTSPSSLRDLLSSELGISFLKYTMNTGEHGPGLTLDKHAHGKNSSFFTLDIAKRKLDSLAADRPFFCYVHFNDPHHPYIPPLSYRDEYIDEIDVTADDAVSFSLKMSDERWRWMANSLPLSDAEWNILYAMYDSTIKYVDSCVGKLFEFVQDQFNNVLVVITADHGELFGEYGLLDHHTVLHDGLIHIPLITHGLDDVGHHTGQPTQHIDIMKTLLSLAGADTSQFQGYDLRKQTRDVAISQALHESVDDKERTNYDRIRQYNSGIDLSYLPTSLTTSARTTDFKLIHTEDCEVLYKLPDEINDVKNNFTETYDSLSAHLDRWFETDAQPSKYAPEDADLNKDMEEHLRNMGYL